MGDEHGCFFNPCGLLGSPEKRYPQLGETLIPITSDCLQGGKTTTTKKPDRMELSARLPLLPALLGRSSALAGAGNSRNMDRRGSRASWVKPQTQQPGALPGRGLGEILILVTGWKLVLPPSTQCRSTGQGGRWGPWGGIRNTILFFFRGLSSPGGR